MKWVALMLIVLNLAILYGGIRYEQTASQDKPQLKEDIGEIKLLAVGGGLKERKHTQVAERSGKPEAQAPVVSDDKHPAGTREKAGARIEFGDAAPLKKAAEPQISQKPAPAEMAPGGRALAEPVQPVVDMAPTTALPEEAKEPASSEGGAEVSERSQTTTDGAEAMVREEASAEDEAEDPAGKTEPPEILAAEQDSSAATEPPTGTQTDAITEPDTRIASAADEPDLSSAAETVSLSQVVSEEPVEEGKTVEEQCGALGPMELGSRARSIAEKLVWLEIETSLRQETYKKIKDYVVIIPRFESRKAARAALSELQEKGIKDFSLFYRGDLENAISLGVFNRLQNAKQRQAELLGAGFDTEIIPRTTDVQGYWLDYRIPRGVDSEAYNRMRALHPDLDDEPQPCPRVVR